MLNIPKLLIEILISLAICIFCICLCFYKIEYENKSLAAVSYNFNGINSQQLFELVTYPDTVNKVYLCSIIHI